MRTSFFFLLFALFAVSTTAHAQTTDEQASEDLDYYNTRNGRDFDTRGGQFWYGTGAILGFSSNSFQSNFVIGLTPIVGYKITDFLSVGPRAGITYNRFRFSSGGGIPDTKLSFFEWSAGPFVRAKVFRGIFAHAEYSLTNEAVSFGPNDEIIRSTRAIPYLGAGLQQGGGPGSTGFEILILFRLSQAEIIGDRPFEIRSGINWNF